MDQRENRFYREPQPSAHQAEQPAEEARGVVQHVPERIVRLLTRYGNERADDSPASNETLGAIIREIRALLAAPAAAEAQPVAWKWRRHALDKWQCVGWWDSIEDEAASEMESRGWDVVRLYATPQAAQSRQAQGGEPPKRKPLEYFLTVDEWQAQGGAPGLAPIHIGNLTTLNQDTYPGLGDWWVQLRIGSDFDEVLARVYGRSPEQARERAAILARAASEPQDAATVGRLRAALYAIANTYDDPELRAKAREAYEAASEPRAEGLTDDRSAFERWAAPRGYSLERTTDSYKSQGTKSAWRGWRAALAAQKKGA